MNSNKNVDAVYLQIKEWILSGEFKADEKINQLELANKLGISRTPVVKALYRLTSEGLIENIPNRGFYVINLSLNELVDLLKIRQSFDVVLAKNVIEIVRQENIDKMKTMFSPFINCEWTDEKINEYWQIDKQFHEYLLELCQNKWLKKIDNSFHIYGKVYRGGLIRKPVETLPEHLNIIAAIEEKNVEKAVKELNEHVQSSIDVLENTIKTLNGFGYLNN